MPVQGLPPSTVALGFQCRIQSLEVRLYLDPPKKYLFGSPNKNPNPNHTKPQKQLRRRVQVGCRV